MRRALHLQPDIIDRMGALTIKLMAILVLSVQILAGITPGRSLWCFGLGCDSGTPTAHAQAGCCPGCPAEGPLPTPIHDDDRCPPGCDCCIEIEVPDVPTLVDSGQSGRDLQQSVLLCEMVGYDCSIDVPLSIACVREGPPPDRPTLHPSLGLDAIRLLV
jgi:hypothetical protein